MLAQVHTTSPAVFLDFPSGFLAVASICPGSFLARLPGPGGPNALFPIGVMSPASGPQPANDGPGEGQAGVWRERCQPALPPAGTTYTT